MKCIIMDMLNHNILTGLTMSIQIITIITIMSTLIRTTKITTMIMQMITITIICTSKNHTHITIKQMNIMINNNNQLRMMMEIMITCMLLQKKTSNIFNFNKTYRIMPIKLNKKSSKSPHNISNHNINLIMITLCLYMRWQMSLTSKHLVSVDQLSIQRTKHIMNSMISIIITIRGQILIIVLNKIAFKVR